MSLGLPVNNSLSNTYQARCLCRLPGFDYDFGCLNASSKPNELNAALHTLFLGGNNVPPLFRWLRLMYPILKRIVSNAVGRAGTRLTYRVECL